MAGEDPRTGRLELKEGRGRFPKTNPTRDFRFGTRDHDNTWQEASNNNIGEPSVRTSASTVFIL